MEMIDVLLTMQMINVTIELIGCWVWVSGNTREYKEDLKAIGCHYHRKRRCWYWHDENYRSAYSAKDSLPDLAEKYGVTTFSSFNRPLAVH